MGAYSRLGAYSRWALIQGGRLFEVGAYSRWAPIRCWALNRINTVLVFRFALYCRLRMNYLYMTNGTLIVHQCYIVKTILE